MAAIKVNFEIAHEASLRTKKTPEGFTHDWEVIVRGLEGADISQFVDKVVFHLHETFPKPKRVVKDAPFSIKESGYAGFMFPIDIYLKNRDEPKKITFTYDLTLQQSGSLKDRYVFQNPNDDFKKKLIKGGGIVVNNNAFYTNPDQESRSRDSFTDEKQQMVSKPKLSSDVPKKHKSKEHKEDIPHRTTTSFENLFGPPIQKPPKVSPDPKKIDKSASSLKSDKKDKERPSSEKVKSKHEHKETKPEKNKNKEDKERKPDKVKSHKEGEKNKDKSSKRPIERQPSPEIIKKKCVSPSRRPSSPAQRSSSASSLKEEIKSNKTTTEIFEQKKLIKSEEKSDKEIKEKRKKEKKSHDRDKERKEKKEHKKESHKSKDSQKDTPKEVPKEIPKPKEVVKEPPVLKDKVVKSEKPVNKFSIENLKKSPQESVEKFEEKQVKEKHKHKKKDKKRDESRDKHKDSSKEKKHKHEKVKEVPVEKNEQLDRRETPIPKEKQIPEPGSPISLDTASQCSSKSGIAKTSQMETEDINTSHSESEDSIGGDEDIDIKVKAENPSPEPEKEKIPSPEPEPEPVVEPPPQKEKSKKHKDKSSRREEKKRKRKQAEEEEVSENRKMPKLEIKTESEHGEGSSSTSAETKLQDNGVSSSLGEDAEPGELSPDYMVQLRGLQQRIMTIKSNEELERVVNLIAETGRYEVTTQTFDFDLCLLDRSTVQQLIQLVGC